MKVTDKQMEQWAETVWVSMDLPENDTLPDHEFSDKFKANMEVLSRQPIPTRTAGRKPIKVAVAVALLSLTTAMAVHHEQIIHVVKITFDELTEYRFSAVPHENNLPTVDFRTIPEDLILHDSGETEINYHRRYGNENGEFFSIFVQSFNENIGSSMILDTENAEISQTTVQGVEGTVVFKNDTTSILWSTDGATFYVTSDFPTDEVLAIVERLKIS